MIQQEPVVIDIRQPDDNTLEGLADIFLGALGFTSLFAIFTVLAGLLIAVFIFWRRSREDDTPNRIR